PDTASSKRHIARVGTGRDCALLEPGAYPGSPQRADPFDNLPRPCYDVKGITRQYDFIRELSHSLNALGWGNYALDHEDANGQFEGNIKFADAVTIADRLVLYKYMVETLASKHGAKATFMPKPYEDQTGNGLHFSFSLWDESSQQNLFADQHDPRGLGLSPLAYSFMGGLLEHATAYIAVTAPTVNPYKRL